MMAYAASLRAWSSARCQCARISIGALPSRCVIASAALAPCLMNDVSAVLTSCAERNVKTSMRVRGQGPGAVGRVSDEGGCGTIAPLSVCERDDNAARLDSRAGGAR